MNGSLKLFHPSALIPAFLGCFGDFARLDATGADLHALRAAVWKLDAYGLQIRVEAARRPIIRMRDIFSELRAFATDFATFSHVFFEYLRAV